VWSSWLSWSAQLRYSGSQIWCLFTRRPRAATVSRADFDREYDELVARAAVESERDAAWRDSHGWEVENERDRLAWEEAPDD
jgi:hypothetical protein